MNNNERRFILARKLNDTIKLLKKMYAQPTKHKYFNMFVGNMFKYVTALKLVADDGGYTDIECDNFHNSINRIFLTELLFCLQKDIEKSLLENPQPNTTFNKLLENLRKNDQSMNIEYVAKSPNTPLKERLRENIDLLNDLRILRNSAQHFNELKVDPSIEKLKDPEIKKVVKSGGEDFEIKIELFPLVINRIYKILH